MDLIFYIAAGACVGLAVGMTGVGGGSLMTPLLILWGIPEKIAIGTDLLYAAATKTSAMAAHQRQGTIRWRLLLLLAAGSIPASILTSMIINFWVPKDLDYGPKLTQIMGYMLIATALVVFFKARIQGESNGKPLQINWFHRNAHFVTVVSGVLLGVLVTLSSVGAGAFCAALLMLLYPRMPALHIVGTDIGHAVPLTLIAGLGHLWIGNVDYELLAGLLIGSIPSVHFATKIASRVPNTVLQPILASLLLIIGIKFGFFWRTLERLFISLKNTRA